MAGYRPAFIRVTRQVYYNWPDSESDYCSVKCAVDALSLELDNPPPPATDVGGLQAKGL
jgi:hypothetical protein